MSQPSLENELTRTRREKDRMLKRLLEELDRQRELTTYCQSLDERLSKLEGLITHAQEKAMSRGRKAQTTDDNQEPAKME